MFKTGAAKPQLDCDQAISVLNDRRSVERRYWIIRWIGGRGRSSSIGLPVRNYVHVYYRNRCERWCADIVRVHRATVTVLIDVASVGAICTIMIMHFVNMAKICGSMSMKFNLRKSRCAHGQQKH